GALPAPALDGDHVDAGGLRPHQHDQARDRRRPEEQGGEGGSTSARSHGQLRKRSMGSSDTIPEFGKSGSGQVGVTNMSALAAGPGIQSARDAVIIALVAVVVVGGVELLLTVFAVPQYVLPKPSQIAMALVTDFHLILPHLGHTLVE